MQVIASNLTEFGNHKGLGWINGKVEDLKLSLSAEQIVPHMGWNEIILQEINYDLENYKKIQKFLFSHSFSMTLDDENILIHISTMVIKNLLIISFDNVVAFQFHPEKSQISANLLKWF